MMETALRVGTEPNAVVMAALELALEHARKGDGHAVAMVLMGNGSTNLYVHGGADVDPTLTLAALEILKLKITSDILGKHDDDPN